MQVRGSKQRLAAEMEPGTRMKVLGDDQRQIVQRNRRALGKIDKQVSPASGAVKECPKPAIQSIQSIQSMVDRPLCRESPAIVCMLARLYRRSLECWNALTDLMLPWCCVTSDLAWFLICTTWFLSGTGLFYSCTYKKTP